MNSNNHPLIRLSVKLAFVATAFAAIISQAHAQPSGGPYGPVQLNYSLPDNAARIIYVAPNGADSVPGSNIDEPTSLEAAIGQAETGDAIILRGGKYRTGNLVFNQGITMQPFEKERPIIKGSRVAKDWESIRGGMWRIKWDTLFPAKPDDWWRREREAARTPLYLFNNDMVFANGKMLRTVGWPGELDEHSFYVDYDKGYVYIKVDPSDKLMEITAFDNALTRAIGEVHGKVSDKIGPQIHGIAFTQYAYRAIEIEGKDPEGVSPESEHGKDVVGTTFANCEFTFCSRVGGYFRGDKLTIRNCLVSDTSTEGLFILSSNDVLIERNIITRNNIEGITGYFPSGVKIFNQCYRVTCRENLIIDLQQSSGIWYDVGNVDGVFVNNWVERSNNGFFFEISKGAICAGNVFVDCDKGVRVLNSREVQVYQNTFINSLANFERTERSAKGDHFGWHPATGPDVDEREGHVFMGNLMYADETFKGPLLEVTQREQVSFLKNPTLEKLDYNVYSRRGDAVSNPLIIWTPSVTDENVMRLGSPSEVTAMYGKFEANSQAYLDNYGRVFSGVELSRYELVSEFPGADSVAKLPRQALETLGWSKKDVKGPGAFGNR